MLEQTFEYFSEYTNTICQNIHRASLFITLTLPFFSWFQNYHFFFSTFNLSSSPWATSMTIAGIGIIRVGWWWWWWRQWWGVSGAIQTTAQILHCRPHVEERGLQALPTRRTLPQHNASFHRVPPEASHKPAMRLGQKFTVCVCACAHTDAQPRARKHTHTHTHTLHISLTLTATRD